MKNAQENNFVPRRHEGHEKNFLNRDLDEILMRIKINLQNQSHQSLLKVPVLILSSFRVFVISWLSFFFSAYSAVSVVRTLRI